MKMHDKARAARKRFIRETTPQTPRREFSAYVAGSLAVIFVVCLALRIIPS